MSTDKTKFPQPFYYLIFQINSADGVKIKNLFTEVKEYFEIFPVLRYAGWDLRISSGNGYKIDLDGIECADSLRRVRIEEKGGLLIQASLGNNFLGWGGDGDKEIRSIALIEVTYNSFIALRKLLDNTDSVASVAVEVGFSGIDSTFSLIYGEMGDHMFFRRSDFCSQENHFTDQFIADDLSQNNLSISAYKIVEKIYRMFNKTDVYIPYVIEKSGKKMIDVDKIKQIN